MQHTSLNRTRKRSAHPAQGGALSVANYNEKADSHNAALYALIAARRRRPPRAAKPASQAAWRTLARGVARAFPGFPSRPGRVHWI